jgi:hypothetical protein
MNLKDKAKLVLSQMDKAYRSDMEYGLYQLNEKARRDFEKIYPEMSQAWFFATDFLEELESGKYDT